MPKASGKIVALHRHRTQALQAIIDDIGARAFVYLREAAEAAGVPVQAVLAEHMLGLALVMESVEGTPATRQLLGRIDDRLGRSAAR